MKDYKSNQKGVSLTTHSIAVQKLGLMLAERLVLSEDIKSIISKACLLHDLGKVCEFFSSYIDTKIESEDFINNRLFHHEVSWAILNCLLPNDEKKDIILHSVYWHHSKKHSKFENFNSGSILRKLSSEDKFKCVEMYNYLTGESKTVNDLLQDSCDTPPYILNDRNLEKKILSISCLIPADRYVSSHDQELILNDDLYSNRIIDSISISKINRDYKVPEIYDLERFKLQESYAMAALKSHTNIIKAPAGSGKTLIGILNWLINGKKKLIWVCPRNAVAESVYRSILEELDNLGLLDIKVELYLSSKIIDKNYDTYENGFKSDIIVTNIDNFLNPNINNWVRDRMFSILSNNVIFDEFHEFISDAPLFSLFVIIMRIRHRYTTSDTLLLSATPSIVSYLWDTINIRTEILPDNDSHYGAAHSEKIKINLVDNVNSIIPKDNSLFVVNAITSTQILTINQGYSEIAHSNYLPRDKNKILTNLFNMYGKQNKNNKIPKVSVVSAPIIQAAMDMSFHEMSEVPFSPESTFQRLGRLNRWGEYSDSTFNIVMSTNRSNISRNESSAIEKLYNSELRNKWVNFINRSMILNDGLFTLDELYMLYNKFVNENNNPICNYIDSKYTNSMSILIKFYPKKYLELDIEANESDNDLPTKKLSSKSSLRDNGFDKIYGIYKIYNTDTYTDAFSIDDVEDIEGNSYEVDQSKLIKELKKLSTDPRFDYDKYKTFKNKNFNSTKLKKIAWNEKTPYIFFNKVYHPKYGIINKSLLQ